ncbi:hypothetical protein FK216_11905 [Moraxellaceae bacterium AER2_44_116]|nr:restriction endonuclease subunit S [Moraxellaceae bacterium]TQC96629.1 hypothetical protein FK216_11905 [Moraxellaceae bacterium AER2_44_116]
MSFPRYAAYKDSGVEWLGEVPEHWEVGAIKRFFTVLDSKRIPLSSEERSYRNGSYPYYGASGVIDWIDDYIFDEDLVLVSEDGANLLTRSTPIAFIATGTYWVNNHAHILKPIDNNLIYWSERIESIDLTPFITGSAQPKLTIDALANLMIAVPPSHEERYAIQLLISQETAKIDNLINEQKKLIELLKEKRQAVISTAVTKGLNPHAPMKDSGVEWLGEVPQGWKYGRLAYIADNIVDGTHHSPQSYPEGDFMYITAKNIKEAGFDFSDISYISTEAHNEIFERCPVRKGDVLYIKDGATAGIAMVNSLNVDFSLLSSVALIRPNYQQLSSEYLTYHLNA